VCGQGRKLGGGKVTESVGKSVAFRVALFEILKKERDFPAMNRQFIRPSISIPKSAYRRQSHCAIFTSHTTRKQYPLPLPPVLLLPCTLLNAFPQHHHPIR
jgi:hypothetical protein